MIVDFFMKNKCLFKLCQFYHIYCTTGRFVMWPGKVRPRTTDPRVYTHPALPTTQPHKATSMPVDSRGPIFVAVQQPVLLQLFTILTLKSTLLCETELSFNQCSWWQTFPLGAYVLAADTVQCSTLESAHLMLTPALVQAPSLSTFPAHAELQPVLWSMSNRPLTGTAQFYSLGASGLARFVRRHVCCSLFTQL